MFQFFVPLIKGRLIGLAVSKILPKVIPVVAGVIKSQQVKKQKENFEKEKNTIDVEVREKK